MPKGSNFLQRQRKLGRQKFDGESPSSASTGAAWKGCDNEKELSAAIVGGNVCFDISVLGDVMSASTATATASGVISDIAKVGYLTVRYTPVFETSSRDYKFPLYCEVRSKCYCTDSSFGTNALTD